MAEQVVAAVVEQSTIQGAEARPASAVSISRPPLSSLTRLGTLQRDVDASAAVRVVSPSLSMTAT